MAVIAAGFWLRTTAFAQGSGVYVVDTYATYQFKDLIHPTGLSFGQAGGLYISDSGANQIWRFVPGQQPTIVGNGTPGYVNGSASQSEFSSPTGLSEASNNYPFPNCPGGWMIMDLVNVADTGNNVVRQVAFPLNCGRVPLTSSTTAGNGTAGYVNGTPTTAEFRSLVALTPPSTGSSYIADGANSVIRLLTASPAAVSTYAGTGTAGFADGYRTGAEFNYPAKAVLDGGGNVFVTDTGNSMIREIDSAGNVTTLAGSTTPGYADGTGANARFYLPTGIAYNAADGCLYVADSGNNRIRRICSGTVTTYAGSGQGGLVNGSLSQAEFQGPTDLVIGSGYMYISDTMNNVVRRIDMTAGVVSTYIE